LKGIDTTIWGKIEEARAYLTRAEQLGAIIDSPTVQSIVSWLLDYETEFGAQASQAILRNLTTNLEEVGIRQGSRILNGDYWISHAFSSYRDGDYYQVPRQVVNTITNYPNYLLNRGLWVILGRSIAGTWKKRMI